MQTSGQNATKWTILCKKNNKKNHSCANSPLECLLWPAHLHTNMDLKRNWSENSSDLPNRGSTRVTANCWLYSLYTFMTPAAVSLVSRAASQTTRGALVFSSLKHRNFGPVEVQRGFQARKHAHFSRYTIHRHLWPHINTFISTLLFDNVSKFLKVSI